MTRQQLIDPEYDLSYDTIVVAQIDLAEAEVMLSAGVFLLTYEPRELIIFENRVVFPVCLILN